MYTIYLQLDVLTLQCESAIIDIDREEQSGAEQNGTEPSGRNRFLYFLPMGAMSYYV